MCFIDTIILFIIGDFFKIFCLACQSIDDPEASHRSVSYSTNSVNGRYRVGTEATYTCSGVYGLKPLFHS